MFFSRNFPSKLEMYISAFLSMCSFSTQKSPQTYVWEFYGILVRKTYSHSKIIPFEFGFYFAELPISHFRLFPPPALLSLLQTFLPFSLPAATLSEGGRV